VAGVKWIFIVVIALLIVWFWPGSDQVEVVAEHSGSSLQSSRYSSDRKSGGERNSRDQLSREELEERITVLWDEITTNHRSPKVVELIRLLREFGERDEMAAFALLDGFELRFKEERWLQARVAIAGGWTLRDPAAAAMALLTEGLVLPKDFEEKTSLPMTLPDGLPDSGRTFPRPSQMAILRQASRIFKLWSQSDPEGAQHFADAPQRDATSAGLRRMLYKHVASGAFRQGSANVDRASIDAILNNPQRTTVDSYARFGQEIYGDVLSEGEPAFTFEEWAARNPELAKDMMLNSPKNVLQSVNFVLGLARVDSDYLGLLETHPSDERFEIASEMVKLVDGIPPDEAVWQLDGRASSWTLTFEQRMEAMAQLVDKGDFSPEERASLETQMEEGAKAYEFMRPK